MKQFARLLEQHPIFCQLTDAIKIGRTPVTMSGMAECHKSHFSAALADCLERQVLLIAQDEATALRMAKDMAVLSSVPVLNYPSRDFVLLGMDGASAEYEHQRLKVLSTLLDGQPCIVTSSVEAVSQLTLPPEKLRDRELVIDFDHSYQLDSLLGDLVAMGYERRDQIEGTCQFACRGGILDIFPPNCSDPVRIEFWDEDVDSINSFKVDTQRRDEPLESVTVPPAREVLFDSHEALKKILMKAYDNLKGKSGVKAKEHLEQDLRRLDDGINPVSIDRYLPLLYPQPSTIFDYMPQAVTVLCEPITCKERLKSVLDQHHEDVRQLLEEGVLFKDSSVFYEDFVALCRNLSSHSGVLMDSFTRQVHELAVKESLILSASQKAAWSGEYEILKEDLSDYCRDGYCCVLFAGTQRSAEALCTDLLRDNFNASFVQDVPQLIPGKIYVLEDNISGGIEYPKLRLAILSHGRSGQSKQKKTKKKSNIKQISDLNIGDFVVHVSHGIGIFEGVVKREIHGVIKDYIQIRYAGTDMLFVPVTQLDLVTKYVSGGEEGLVKLNKLNSGEWQKTRARVKKEVKDMADELIKLYAQRMSVEGYAFGPDTEWQHDFERRFPYEETDDQLRCIQEIKDDMERSSPMDRLLCGDVGFGKTEVAIRAAFKAVMDGKQVAVLVPTTILAWQHFQTFKSRMEGFPIKVDLLSRFRNARDSEQVLTELKRGQIDIVIGTHRIIQNGVKFKDLGLCIIDEEQRFGVAHKEKLKEMRKNVDVLTLSATPIPRTLSMAMSGIRDMSTIDEAPQDRQPVQTYVLEHDWNILAQAIRKELRRGGQVFYLYNKVETIEHCANIIQQFVPEARVVFAHGKMSEEQLSKVWKKMLEHEIDVLVCTTIIETGVDISNANTLIIEDADRLGLSQLYQIRGRVGRSSRRAFAYLTVKPGKALNEVATKRLSAIREFTTFGSGFRIAMRDLQIRGAGNILGAQQHGHMEAVGYELYMKLLSEAIAIGQGKEVQYKSEECQVDIRIGAHIPEEYIEDLTQRIDIYKKIASIETKEDALDVLDELIDRFGEPPNSVKGLVDVSLLRNTAARMGINKITQKNDSLIFLQETFDLEMASYVAASLKGRIMVNMGKEPYLAVRVLKGEKAIDAMRIALECMDQFKKEKKS